MPGPPPGGLVASRTAFHRLKRTAARSGASVVALLLRARQVNTYVRVFTEKTLVAAGQCTKVDPSVAPQVAGLLGCGVVGIGAAINTGQVGRGDTVAVIGCGGDAAVAGANLAGAA